VHAELFQADALCEKWGFRSLEEAASSLERPLSKAGSFRSERGKVWPGGQALHAALFTSEPIEWNRIGHFQDVTMRLIAERLLPDAAGSTYVDREIVNQTLKPLLQPNKSFHVYCSALNPGSTEVMAEVSREHGFSMQLENPAHHAKLTDALHVTTDAAKLPNCDHMLLYLTSQTWTRGEASATLGSELMMAMSLDIHVLVVHEMPGGGGQEARFGCEFGAFFSCADGTTPTELLQRGIYSSVAVPLKGGPWRKASMMLLGIALGMSKDDVEAATKGDDVLGLDAETSKVIKVVVEQSAANLRSPLTKVWSTMCTSLGELSMTRTRLGSTAVWRSPSTAV